MQTTTRLFPGFHADATPEEIEEGHRLAASIRRTLALRRFMARSIKGGTIITSTPERFMEAFRTAADLGRLHDFTFRLVTYPTSKGSVADIRFVDEPGQYAPLVDLRRLYR